MRRCPVELAPLVGSYDFYEMNRGEDSDGQITELHTLAECAAWMEPRRASDLRRRSQNDLRPP